MTNTFEKEVIKKFSENMKKEYPDGYMSIRDTTLTLSLKDNKPIINIEARYESQMMHSHMILSGTNINLATLRKLQKALNKEILEYDKQETIDYKKCKGYK